MVKINFTLSNASEFAKEATIAFSQCAENCRAECITYVKYNALNSNLWMIFASMALLTLFHLLNTNEDAMRKVAEMTKQPNIEHVKNTVGHLLTTGIILLIIYVASFLWTIGKIHPMG